MDLTNLTITRADDWHCHLREGDILKAVLPHSATAFSRIVAMPNLKIPITTPELALAYKQQISELCPSIEPLIPCYLQESTQASELLKGFESGAFFSVKYYPRGATTLSNDGVHDWKQCSSVFDAMIEADIPLMIHGEVTSKEVDIFDRESEFLKQVLAPLLKRHKGIKVVLEHLTTADAVDFVQHSDDNIAATITPHHLLLDRSDLLSDGLHPHRFCYPVVKTKKDKQALRKAATSGNPRFMLGTDSAPHLDSQKHNRNPKAGIFSSPIALALYVQVFEEENALDKLEAFASINGAKFHNMPISKDKITLKRLENPLKINDIHIEALNDRVTVFEAPRGLYWQIA